MEQGKNEGAAAIGALWNNAQPQRPKNWAELSIEEKLERLREHQRNVAQAQSRTIARLGERVRELESHQHGAGGEVMVGVGRRHGYGEAECSGYDPLA